MVATFEEKYNLFRNFCLENNRLPSDKNPDERYLSVWFGRMKQSVKKGKISQEKLDLLLQVRYFENWYNCKLPEFNTFQENYNIIRNFCQENNRLPRNRNTDNLNEYKAGQVLRYMKICIRKNKLSGDQIDLLLEIPEFRRWYENNVLAQLE